MAASHSFQRCWPSRSQVGSATWPRAIPLTFSARRAGHVALGILAGCPCTEPGLRQATGWSWWAGRIASRLSFRGSLTLQRDQPAHRSSGGRTTDGPHRALHPYLCLRSPPVKFISQQARTLPHFPPVQYLSGMIQRLPGACFPPSAQSSGFSPQRISAYPPRLPVSAFSLSASRSFLLVAAPRQAQGTSLLLAGIVDRLDRKLRQPYLLAWHCCSLWWLRSHPAPAGAPQFNGQNLRLQFALLDTENSRPQALNGFIGDAHREETDPGRPGRLFLRCNSSASHRDFPSNVAIIAGDQLVLAGVDLRLYVRHFGRFVAFRGTLGHLQQISLQASPAISLPASTRPAVPRFRTYGKSDVLILFKAGAAGSGA